jgi:hypothetical protein
MLLNNGHAALYGNKNLMGAKIRKLSYEPSKKVHKNVIILLTLRLIRQNKD